MHNLSVSNDGLNSGYFWFEQSHDVTFGANWAKTTGYYVVSLELLLYVTVLILNPKIRQVLPAWELKLPLFVWNFGLAVFSILGARRMIPELFISVSKKGFEYSVCNGSYAYQVKYMVA